MNTNRDQPWLDLLVALGKELGVDAPRPPRPEPWASATEQQVVQATAQRTRLVESTESMSRDALADLLEGFASRIRGGEVSLRSGSYSVHVDVPDEVIVDVSAASQEHPQGTDLELGITVQWRTEAPGGPDGVTLD